MWGGGGLRGESVGVKPCSPPYGSLQSGAPEPTKQLWFPGILQDFCREELYEWTKAMPRSFKPWAQKSLKLLGS